MSRAEKPRLGNALRLGILCADGEKPQLAVAIRLSDGEGVATYPIEDYAEALDVAEAMMQRARELRDGLEQEGVGATLRKFLMENEYPVTYDQDGEEVPLEQMNLDVEALEGGIIPTDKPRKGETIH